MSYNVWYGFTKKPERKANYLKFMQAQAPDVVSLQELNHYTPEKLADDARAWGHPYSVLLKEKGFPTGITSSHPITAVKRTIEDTITVCYAARHTASTFTPSTYTPATGRFESGKSTCC